MDAVFHLLLRSSLSSFPIVSTAVPAFRRALRPLNPRMYMMRATGREIQTLLCK